MPRARHELDDHFLSIAKRSKLDLNQRTTVLQTGTYTAQTFDQYSICIAWLVAPDFYRSFIQVDRPLMLYLLLHFHKNEIHFCETASIRTCDSHFEAGTLPLSYISKAILSPGLTAALPVSNFSACTHIALRRVRDSNTWYPFEVCSLSRTVV